MNDSKQTHITWRKVCLNCRNTNVAWLHIMEYKHCEVCNFYLGPGGWDPVRVTK